MAIIINSGERQAWNCDHFQMLSSFDEVFDTLL